MRIDTFRSRSCRFDSCSDLRVNRQSYRNARTSRFACILCTVATCWQSAHEVWLCYIWRLVLIWCDALYFVVAFCYVSAYMVCCGIRYDVRCFVCAVLDLVDAVRCELCWQNTRTHTMRGAHYEVPLGGTLKKSGTCLDPQAGI